MVEIAGACREPEHRQYATVREPFAQAFLDKARIDRCGGNLRNKTSLNPLECLCAFQSINCEPGPDEESVARVCYFRRMAVDPLLYDLSDGCSSIAGRWDGGRLGPCIKRTEFAVDTVTLWAWEKGQLRECLPEHLLAEDTLQDWAACSVYVRRGRGVGCYTCRTLEVVIVMAAAAAESKCNRECGAAAASTANTLLVVELHRRHIGHHDSKERSDVDASLHGCGDAKDVKVVGERALLADRDVLKQPLPVARNELVRLAGEFGAIQAENRTGIGGKPSVVVHRLVGVVDAYASGMAERSLASGADPAAGMQMDAAALVALEIDFSGAVEEETIIEQYSPVKYTRVR